MVCNAQYFMINNKGEYMKHKAVIFDLFETLITEWGHKKYTKKRDVCRFGHRKKNF